MKHQYSKFLCLLLTAVLCICTAGCGSTESLVYLNYSTGMDADGDYNSDLYGMNINDLGAADPGCFYVSEEEDPIYGGYFYMYPTSSAANTDATLNDPFFDENKITNAVAACYRSKDLYHWDRCGSIDGGYTLLIDQEDWCQSNFWAPEVIRNPADGKYYMYFSASAAADYGVKSISSSSNAFDRLYLGVAVSDSPVGPFDVLYDIDAATGKRVPTINFQTGCGTQYPWAAIDVSPFFDDNGDLYLYFNKHQDDHYSRLNGSWGMKMKTMSQPDYSTVVCLAKPGAISVNNTPGKIEEVTTSGEYFSGENGINEGPQMLRHNGKYYLTYSSNGYEHITYSVHQAIGDSPLGTFTKPGVDEGNPVLDGSSLGFMNGTAHHSIVRKDDEMFIVYHRHDSIFGYDSGWGRSMCVDRLNFVENAAGVEVLTANGPSKSLQWLSQSISGYENLAQPATVQISTGIGVQYLTDGIMPFYTVTQDHCLQVDGEDVTVTLKWDTPVSVSSVMIYNAREADHAFSKISDLRFKLADQPDWASQPYDWAVIKDLMLPERYYDAESEEYISCSPAVAEFEAMLITELQFTILVEDRLVAENKFGDKNTALKLSEIVVLGGAENE